MKWLETRKAQFPNRVLERKGADFDPRGKSRFIYIGDGMEPAFVGIRTESHHHSALSNLHGLLVEMSDDNKPIPVNKALEPHHISKLRTRVYNAISKSMIQAQEVLDGKRKWSNQQVNLFGKLVNKVIPDLHHSSNDVTHSFSGSVKDLPLEQLLAIAQSGESEVIQEAEYTEVKPQSGSEVPERPQRPKEYKEPPLDQNLNPTSEPSTALEDINQGHKIMQPSDFDFIQQDYDETKRTFETTMNRVQLREHAEELKDFKEEHFQTKKN